MKTIMTLAAVSVLALSVSGASDLRFQEEMAEPSQRAWSVDWPWAPSSARKPTATTTTARPTSISPHTSAGRNTTAAAIPNVRKWWTLTATIVFVAFASAIDADAIVVKKPAGAMPGGPLPVVL